MHSRIWWFFVNILAKSKAQFIRTLYWNYRARDIHETWGEGSVDFEVIRNVIKRINPTRVLDIGCGSGRCFPLYFQEGIVEIVGQEVSKDALQMCKKRFFTQQYTLVNEYIHELDYPDKYFDLVISTRVLAAVLPERIAETIKKLCKWSCFIYLNEMTDSDYVGPLNYWYKHDYYKLMIQNGFFLIEQGNIGEQTWVLFGSGK